MTVPDIGDALPRRGNRFVRCVGRTMLALWGWRFEGELPNRPKLVAIGAPHTSNWDFVLGMAAIFALGVRVDWMGKHTLFRPPMGVLMRWLGGVPVDRSARNGTVRQMVETFARRERFILALAPEGTRKRVARWRTGFYRIAEQAGVPVLPVALDWKRKVIRFGEPLAPSGDLDGDLHKLKAFFDTATGRNPNHA